MIWYCTIHWSVSLNEINVSSWSISGTTLVKLGSIICLKSGAVRKFFNHSNLNANFELPLPIEVEKKINSFPVLLIFIGICESPEKNRIASCGFVRLYAFANVVKPFFLTIFSSPIKEKYFSFMQDLCTHLMDNMLT